MSQQMLEPIHARRPYLGPETDGYGLKPYKCAACGKRFEATKAHGYRIEYRNKVSMYCSWTCFAPVEEKAREQFRKRMTGGWVWESRPKSEKAKAREKLRDAQKRLARWEAERASDGFLCKTPKQQAEIEEKIAHWRAEVELRGEEARENA